MSDYDMSIHSNPDAAAWARFFMETATKNGWRVEGPDEATMLGWFANAMCAALDARARAPSSPETPPCPGAGCATRGCLKHAAPETPAPEGSARVPFNINDYVWVKFTPDGERIYREVFAGLPVEPPKLTPDARGFVRFQAWQVMEYFGPHIGMGRRVPFETTIEVEIPPASPASAPRETPEASAGPGMDEVVREVVKVLCREGLTTAATVLNVAWSRERAARAAPPEAPASSPSRGEVEDNGIDATRTPHPLDPESI